MALPFFNSKTKEYQEKSLKNQSQLSSKMKSGFNDIGNKLDNQTQILGRVESWLDETYELHREFYQSEDESRRERMRLLRRQKLAGASVGATTGGNGDGESGGGGIGSFIAKTIATAVGGAFGLKQIKKFFKSTPKATGAVDDLTKKTKNLTKAQKASQKQLKAETKERLANNKASQESRNKLKKLADAETKIRDEKIRTGKTGKVSGSLADDVAKAGKVADTALDASKASKIIARVFPPVAVAEALAVNIKDGYDLYSAAFDDDIATELQGEDLGGVIGGAIGAAIGLVGGPMGAVLGASLGNMVGSWVGDYFDPNFDKEFIQSSENLIVRKEGLATSLAALEADRGNMSDREYKLEHDKLMREKQFLDNATAEQATVQKLFDARTKASEEYNIIAQDVARIEAAGGTAGDSLLRSLKAAEDTFNEADKRFDAQAKEFEKQLDEKLALKSAIDKGIYDKDLWGDSEIEADRLGELTQGELRGILADKDLSDSDTLLVQKALRELTGIGGDPTAIKDTATVLQEGFIAAVKTGDGVAQNQFIKQVQGMGGEAAVAALAAGTLTQEMIIKPKPSQSALGIATQANIMKESGGKLVAENLNYGGSTNKRIREIFGSRTKGVSDEELNAIKSDPQKMSEMMYGGRMGNTEAGDGFKYRGRGYIQLTGKNNYAAASKEIFGDNRLVDNPDLALDPVVAKQITDWFMEKNAPNMAKKLGIDMNNMTQDQANQLATSTIAGKKIQRGSDGYLSSTLDKVDMYAQKIKSGTISASGNGSASAGGSAVNSMSAQQAQSQNGVTVVDNSTTVTDNSTNASSTSSYTQQVSPRRVNTTGIRLDMVMPT
jgi:predicted chitinase